MIDGGGNKLQQRFQQLWEIIRYRKWVVYDTQDCFIIYMGKRRNCIKVLDESCGGLVVIPFKEEKEITHPTN